VNDYRLEVSFRNLQQEDFYFARNRRQIFSGGFNNGKSYSGCLKAFTLLSTFPNYRIAICRQVRADLMKTTYQTFFKICPRDFVERNNEQEGLTVLKNGSTIYWMHLDKVDESTLRGLEVNSVLVDQAEEIEEKVFDILDARIGRWDNAIVPEDLITADWPKNPAGFYIAPSYHMLLCNPDTQFHFIYRKFHPDSLERDEKAFWTEGEWDAGLGSAEAYQDALKHDQEWVDKFVRGKWGISAAAIHIVDQDSLLEWTPELDELIHRKGNLCRILDHGDASPTCCLWVAALAGVYIFYREYYSAGQVISVHRQAIADLSIGEQYSANYADPAIFKKQSQKDGGFWSVSDEYLSRDIDGPPLAWIPADNNEYATRNRLNELLKKREGIKHPHTNADPAPRIYFIKQSKTYPFGCFHTIKELGSQRRKILGYFDGKAIYDDAREESVADHAYDCVRYYIAMHGNPQREAPRKPPKMSFKFYKMLAARKRNAVVAASVD